MTTPAYAFITGGAGFIGSNLADTLLAQGWHVTVYDHFSTGQRRFLEQALAHPNFTLVTGDLLDEPTLQQAMQTFAQQAKVSQNTWVFHLAANADVRFGTAHPRKDLEQNTIATYNVLEAMRQAKLGNIAFSSTGSVYGEARVIPTPEDAPFPIQTSLYGASKLAGEGMIAAYAEGFNMRACIFRFVSILGPRYTHGHVFDFHKALLKDPTQLSILGDGNQRKSYLDVSDCVAAIVTATEHVSTLPAKTVQIYNLGTAEYVQVNDSVALICQHLNCNPTRHYSGGQRGWIGDNPFIFLDTQAITALGWKPRYSIAQGIARTLDWLEANTWVYN